MPSRAAAAARPWPRAPPRTPRPIAKPAAIAAYNFTSFRFDPPADSCANADVATKVTSGATRDERPSFFEIICENSFFRERGGDRVRRGRWIVGFLPGG